MGNRSKILRVMFTVLGLVGIIVLASTQRELIRVQASPGQGALPAGAQARTPEAKPAGGLGIVTIRVVDFETGFSVPASVYIKGAEDGQYAPRTFSTDDYGRLRLELQSGFYLYEVSAPGYKPLRSYTEAAPGFPQPQEPNLNPLTLPEELRAGLINSKLRPGYTLVYGYISDSVMGRPLAGVQVHLEKANVDATTNARGYFEVSVPSPPTQLFPGVPPPGLAGTDNISFKLAGYETDVELNVDLYDGLDCGWKLGLQPGTGAKQHDDMHKLRKAAMGIGEKEEPQSAEPGPPLPPELRKRLLDWVSTPAKEAPVNEEIAPQGFSAPGNRAP